MKRVILCLTSILLLSVLVTHKAWAQITIQDPEFKNFLIQTYPSLFNSNQELDTIASASITGVFNCTSTKKIENVEGIQYFKNLDEIKLGGNILLTFPNINRISNLRRLHLDTNNLQTLPDMSKLKGLLHLNVRENNLTSLPDLSAFTKIANLYVDNNQLTSLPDLSQLVNLRLFLISNNQLKSIPALNNHPKLEVLLAEYNNLTSFPSLVNCPALQRLSFYRNQLTSFPDITGLTNLEEITGYNNNLTSIPDLSNYLSLTKVSLKSNYLTFEDILPITNHPNFNNFEFFPQNKVGQQSSLNIPETSQLVIDLNIDNFTTTNTYHWYKNGASINTTSNGKLIIDNVSKQDEGVYSCIVTNSNPKLAGKTLQSYDYTVVVSPCFNLNQIAYTIPANGCQLPFTLMIDENSYTGTNPPYIYSIKNKIDSSVIISSSNFLSISREGFYELRIKNSKNCESKTSIKVKREELCEPVFYPEEDGIADTYFIEVKGYAKIFNNEGDLINEFSTPAYWNGKTKKGYDAIPGLYVIVVNENISIKLTLIR